MECKCPSCASVLIKKNGHIHDPVPGTARRFQHRFYIGKYRMTFRLDIITQDIPFRVELQSHGTRAAEVLALLHGFACITHRGNQVVSGVAINILAAGLTVVLGAAWFARGGQTPALEAAGQRLLPIFFPGAGDNILVYAALTSVPLTWWIVARTRFGLRLRAVGEMPLAVEAAGISVTWLRYRAVLLCGLFSGLAGAYLAIAQNAGFSRDMTAGQGFIALAAVIFGKWRPFPAFGACLMFGLLDAVAIRLQGVRLPGIGEVPVQLIQALPYLLTIFLLAGFIGRAIAPKAIGVPYQKEH